MENEQMKEWAEAQKIELSIDLVEAAKKHLKFLTAVQRNQFLYEDRVLQRAIYRYNAFWLPLLAKHLETPVSEGHLVVPFDCELIWHCHRLNPLQYKFDCEKLYGKVLGNYKVVSSLQGASKSASEELWNKMYPEEPFELDVETPFSADVLQNGSQNDKFTDYDLVDAVKRQMSFTYQMCKPHMSDELFLREAMARYKGFLHIIRTNRKMGQKLSTVPTYDIDLMWHTHQLYAVMYCRDMMKLTGIVLQHNDAHPDKGEGSDLENGFYDTTKQWEQTFGLRYWRAGVLYKENIPTPVTKAQYKFNVEAKEFNSLEKCGSKIQFATTKAAEVLVEFVDIKNLPGERKANLFIAFSKKETDKVFNTKSLLGISSASKDKMFALFQCEPKGEFLLELVSYSLSSKSMKLLGTCSISFEEMSASGTQLSVNKWVSVDLVSDLENSEPVLLHVAMSFSPPMRAPQLFQLVQSKNDPNQAHVLDDGGKKLFTVEKGNIVKDQKTGSSELLTEVYCIDSGEKHAVIEFQGNCWSVKGTHGSFKLQNNSGKDDSLFELIGFNNMVKVFPGRRLQFEPKEFEDKSMEQDFVSAVEFSKDYPYGRAVALINTKLGTIKAIDESIVLAGITLAFMLSDNLKAEDIVKNACGCVPCKTSEIKEEFESKQIGAPPSKVPCYSCDAMASKMNEGLGSQQMGLPCRVCFLDDAVDLKMNEGFGSQKMGMPCVVCYLDDTVDLKMNEGFGSQKIGLPCRVCFLDDAVDLKMNEGFGSQQMGDPPSKFPCYACLASEMDGGFGSQQMGARPSKYPCLASEMDERFGSQLMGARPSKFPCYACLASEMDGGFGSQQMGTRPSKYPCLASEMDEGFGSQLMGARPSKFSCSACVADEGLGSQQIVASF